MKKVLLTVAVVAALASCTSNEIDNVLNEKVIEFTNLNEKVTRAANDVSDNYQVYAKSSGNSTEWFIDDVLYGKSGSGTTANTSTTNKAYYWPEGQTVNFYAWAPASVVAKTATVSTPAISIEYTAGEAADKDFTIAAPITGKSSGTVEFKFSHMLAKVNVTATLDAALTGFTIDLTSATVDLGVAASKGTIDPTSATPAWASTGTPTTHKGKKSYMIIPQATTGTTIQLKGVVIKKGSTEIFNGDMSVYTIAKDAITGNMFEKGKSYNLSLTISSSSTDGSGTPGQPGQPIFNEIAFSADIAASWGEVNPPATAQP